MSQHHSTPSTPHLASTLVGLRDAIASREVRSEDVTRAALARADHINHALNALTQVFHKEAIEQARSIDRRLDAREHVGPLAGVPIVLKDNICLSWGRTTCASRLLEHYHSPYTATAAQRLIDAGAIILAKGNLDEFAMGSSNEHSCFGPALNPWDTSRVPGGSSGGSAIAVSAGVVPASLGSDTGGSIRMPAGWCNLVGFKPSYGRVSRHGLVAYASSLDQIGPFARTVADAALIAQIISGGDPHDATCDPSAAPDLLSALEEPVNRLVIGVPTQARSSANHPGVAQSLDRAIEALRELGALVVDVDLPRIKYSVGAYYIIAVAEASSNLARLDAMRYGKRATLAPGEGLFELYARSRAEGFGPEVQRRIMLGTHVLSSGYQDAYYTTALKVRRLIQQDFQRVFRGEAAHGAVASQPACHAILMPSAPGPAFRLGERSSDPVAMYLEDIYTVGVNLAGLPAITIPGGFVRESGLNGAGDVELPVGVQLIGASFEDALLLRIARMLERTSDLAGRTPPIP